jgi:hypothetical protein
MKANVNRRNLFMEQNTTGGNYLSSVKNALRILNSFTMDEPEKKVTDISTELGLVTLMFTGNHSQSLID